VTFAGAVPYADMPAEYFAADIGVFPSVWTEGFGMVALEAMRCGLPVVVSDRPGFRSFIRDGENGVIVDDPTAIGSLACGVMTLLEDQAYADRIARAGKATSLRYTPENVAKTFIAFVHDFVNH
jgi:phosphatidylinositol alpha-mannosyltransferase